MKKILITGVAGFLGSHLAESLINEGHFVYGIDNLSTGYKTNLKNVINHPNFEFIHHDVIEPFNILVDEIYSMASPASPILYQKDPIFTLKTNVIGSINMLDLAMRNKAKILLTSTSEIYGDPLEHPQKETYNGNVNSCSARACYDIGKKCAETAFSDYHRQFNVDIRIVRLFNVFGDRLNSSDGRVVSNFITQALKNDPITVYGDGSQTRSFMFVEDAIIGLKAMMNNDKKFLGPVNIGSMSEFTILELAKIIIELTNSKSEIVFKPLPQDDPKQRKPDISLAKEKLNWEPKISLKDGLLKTIEHFKKELKL